jgi:mannose/cellobiose epimerase-like protein (N-acyl-D-glucosamine 2-epimerase family)
MRAPVANAFTSLAKAAAWAQRWLFDSAFPLWWQGGRNPAGGFFERLDADGRPQGERLRFRVQARQTYVYAVAGRLGWPGPWREAVGHGAQFVTRATDESGLVLSLFERSGEPAPAPFDLYDQSFALLAYAYADGVFPGSGHAQAATRLREELRRRLAHPGGGFEEDRPARTPLRSNPHMHLFEAALAWVERTGDPAWRELADELGDLATRIFIDPEHGRLREFFAIDWTPAPGEAGRLTEPGHQFEWTWLLYRHAYLGGAPNLAAAERMARLAFRTGVDPRRNVAFNQQAIDGPPLDLRARLWPQTERLKAALSLRRSLPREREAWEQEALLALAGLRLYLDDPAPGLWRDTMLENGVLIEEAAPASSMYHIVCALAELISAAR